MINTIELSYCRGLLLGQCFKWWTVARICNLCMFTFINQNLCIWIRICVKFMVSNILATNPFCICVDTKLQTLSTCAQIQSDALSKWQCLPRRSTWRMLNLDLGNLLVQVLLMQIRTFDSHELFSLFSGFFCLCCSMYMDLQHCIEASSSHTQRRVSLLCVSFCLYCSPTSTVLQLAPVLRSGNSCRNKSQFLDTSRKQSSMAL